MSSLRSEIPAGATETGLGKKIAFQADWFSNGQFSGFFWAEQAGLYDQEGIDFDYLPFDYGVDFVGQVASGEVAFGTAEAYILMGSHAASLPRKRYDRECYRLRFFSLLTLTGSIWPGSR